MADEEEKESPRTLNAELQDGEKEKDSVSNSDDKAANLVSSRASHLFGDLSNGTAYRFTTWLNAVRRRSVKNRSSGFPNRTLKIGTMSFRSLFFDLQRERESVSETCDSPNSAKAQDISLWERLGKANVLDIESTEFSWNKLSSLHHTEHNSSTEHSEDDIAKALEVTVNSGGVVFFALFNCPEGEDHLTRETAAVIKFASSRKAIQSERLGYEFAKFLGVRTPQARVVHSSSFEWQNIKDSTERAKDAAFTDGDELGELTSTELLEALEMSRCLLLMNYIHGSPLLESSNAFNSQESSEKTAGSLGRVLMLDLVLRNEDRLACRHLGWRGNSGNLLFAENLTSAKLNSLEETFDYSLIRYRIKGFRYIHKERKCSLIDGRLGSHRSESLSQISDCSDVSEIIDSPKSENMDINIQDQSRSKDFYIVAIDSGVPRRPPAGKRSNDQNQYPKLVQLLLHSVEYSSNLLHEITAGKLGFSADEDLQLDSSSLDMIAIVHQFRDGFRGALRDLQGLHLFLLTLYQKLDTLLRMFLTIINRNQMADYDKDECGSSESGFQSNSPKMKERNHSDLIDSSDSQKTPPKSSSGNRESPDFSCSSSSSRDSLHGKHLKGSSELSRSLRLTMKLRDFNKYAKIDVELNREIEQWNEMLRTDVMKLCQENNFKTGFFEGSDNPNVIDAYELKVRLEHILERISLIFDAANTERPSLVDDTLFIGGALAARSVHILERLEITHILCLCSNEIGQSDSQYPDHFEYKNLSISDNEDAKISSLFEETSDFIEHVEHIGGKVLVHCFEGKSRSATVVLAYLISRKNYTLLEAWQLLKRVHRRAQPNDGFAKTLLELDEKTHGKVSMEWNHRKPAMKVCPICGKNAGISNGSLKLHLQKSHRKTPSRSIDSAMAIEIRKTLQSLELSRGNSTNSTPKYPHRMINRFDQ